MRGKPGNKLCQADIEPTLSTTVIFKGLLFRFGVILGRCTYAGGLEP